MREKQKRWACLGLALVLLLTLLTQTAAPAGYDGGYIGGLAGDGAGVLAQGLDLSTWQGHAVNFDKIYEQGYRFVILRAGFAQTKDDCFEENYTRAKAAGLDVGVYLYSYAETTQSALAEANACKQWLSGKQLEYPVYYDLEDPQAHASLTKEELTALAMTFLDEMAKDGWLVGLYSCKSWLENKMDTKRICEKYECWMALFLNSGSFETADEYDERYGMWQYSCSGVVEGVPGLCDKNVAFKDYPAICREYGFNGYVASGAPLSISGFSVPEILTTGSKLAVKGRVSSAQGNLSNVTVGVYDEADNMVTGRSAGPKAASYDLTNLADGVKLDSLTAGEYIVRVTATNSAASRVLFSQPLTVADSGMTAVGVSVPEGFKQGSMFTLNGSVLAAAELQSVTAEILDKQGKLVCSASAEPKTTKFELQTLSKELPLTELAVGSYTYRVRAKTEKNSAALVTLAFSVWEKNDPIALEGFSLNESYLYGALTGLSGSVVSTSSALSALKLVLRNSRGEAVAEAEATSLGKTAELSDYNATLFTQALDCGSYVCEITAANAGGPVTLRKQSFRIVQDGISLCGCELPVSLNVGDTLLVQGTVASDYSRLRFVNIALYDYAQNAVLSASAVPESQAFDLSQLRGKLPFSDLIPGEYRLRITAENEHGYLTLYDAPLWVANTNVLQSEGEREFQVLQTNNIRWEDGHFRLGGMSYGAGEAPTLWGTLVSDYSNLTRFSAALYNEKEELVATAERYCDSETADIAALNEQLRFSALPEGRYTLKLYARNACGESCVAFERFSVSQCPHADVATGQFYQATCTNGAVVCNSRCQSCGAAVRQGSVTEAAAHSYAGGSCVYCGKIEPAEVTVTTTLAKISTNNRYVFAVERESVDGEITRYLLDDEARWQPLETTQDAGTLQVSAQMLWRVIRTQDSYALVNWRGERLHFLSDGLSAACGTSRTDVRFVYAPSVFSIEYCGAPDHSSMLLWSLDMRSSILQMQVYPTLKYYGFNEIATENDIIRLICYVMTS